MGIYDRDYFQQGRGNAGAFGGMPQWSVTTWLIIINVAVFVINLLVLQTVVDADNVILGQYHPIEHWGYFSVTLGFFHLQLWRLITFQFLHENFNHILFNMLALFFFGPMVESFWGTRRYIAFYLLCGVAGPVMYTLMWAAGFLIHDPRVPLIGASAGIFGVLIAATLIAPDATVLIYGILPAKLKVVAWVALGYAAYTVFSNGTNAGGEAAHLGGAAAGFALMKNPQWLNVFNFNRRRMRMQRSW